MPGVGHPSMPGGGYPSMPSGGGDPNGYYYNRPGMGSYPDQGHNNYPENKYPPVYDNRFPDDRGGYYDRRPPSLPPAQMYPDQRYPPSRGQYPVAQPYPNRNSVGSGWYNMPPSGGGYQPVAPQPMAAPNYHPPAYPATAGNYPPSGYPVSANALPETGYNRPYNREYSPRPYPNRPPYPMGPERYPTEAEYERAGYGPYLGIGIFPMPQRGGGMQTPGAYGRPASYPPQPPPQQYYPQEVGQGPYNPYNNYGPSGYDNVGPGDGLGG